MDSLSGMLSPETYDDDREFEEYLLRNRDRLRTEFERRAEELGTKREKARFAIADGLESRWAVRALAEYESDANQDVRDAIGDSLESFRAFQERVTHRIRAEFLSNIAQPNRCPRCRRIVKTPAAAQCLWCGCDWHSA